jgi:hypothetical protein
MRTRHAIMFRLSNKVVQVNFQDHTEIMLSSETKVVTYVNKKGERSTYPLNSAMESANLEMVKRLKYTKDILTHMLNANVANINRPATNGGEIGGRDPTAPFDAANPTGPTASQTGRPQTSNMIGGDAGRAGNTERV